jgi:hypothetical protein
VGGYYVRIKCLATKNPTNPRKERNLMTKILIAYIIGLVVGAGSTLYIVEHLLN